MVPILCTVSKGRNKNVYPRLSTGLRSHNSQTCPTHLRISDLGNQVQFFDNFDRGFITAGKLFALGQLLNMVYGRKEFLNVH